MTTYVLDELPELAGDSAEALRLAVIRDKVCEDDLVKLVFRIEVDGALHVESMWVLVTERQGDELDGLLDNDPFCTDEIKSGQRVSFRLHNILEVYEEAE